MMERRSHAEDEHGLIGVQFFHRIDQEGDRLAFIRLDAAAIVGQVFLGPLLGFEGGVSAILLPAQKRADQPGEPVFIDCSTQVRAPEKDDRFD